MQKQVETCKKVAERDEKDKYDYMDWYVEEGTLRLKYEKLWHEEKEESARLRKRLEEAEEAQKKVERGRVTKMQVRRIKRNRKAKTSALKKIKRG